MSAPWFCPRYRERRRLARTLRREAALAETLCDYEGKWVAVIDSEIVASADTLYDLTLDPHEHGLLGEPLPTEAVIFQVVSGPCFSRSQRE